MANISFDRVWFGSKRDVADSLSAVTDPGFDPAVATACILLMEEMQLRTRIYDQRFEVSLKCSRKDVGTEHQRLIEATVVVKAIQIPG